jgi:biotin transporter BioY
MSWLSDKVQKIDPKTRTVIIAVAISIQFLVFLFATAGAVMQIVHGYDRSIEIWGTLLFFLVMDIGFIFCIHLLVLHLRPD